MIMNPLMLDYVCRWIYGRNVFQLRFWNLWPLSIRAPIPRGWIVSIVAYTEHRQVLCWTKYLKYSTIWLIESSTAIETSFPSVAFKVKVKYGSLPFKSLLVVLTSIGKGQFDRAHLPVWSFWFIHLVFHFNESGSDSSVLVFLFQLWRFGSKKKPRCNVFHTSYGSWHSFLAVFNGEHSQRILKCCKKWNRSEEFVQIMQIWTS